MDTTLPYAASLTLSSINDLWDYVNGVERFPTRPPPDAIEVWLLTAACALDWAEWAERDRERDCVMTVKPDQVPHT